MHREHARALPIVAAWVAAAVAAVAVASWGVALVGRSVTDDRPAPLSADQVEERLEQASAEPAPTTATAAPGDPSSSTTTTPAAPAASTSVPGATPSTTAVPGPAPTTTAPPATAAPTPPAGETRTYTLVGGTASLRFEATGVTVVFANPAQGFDVEIEPEHGNGVKVEFESETHRSRLDGWWDAGPQDRTEERPDD